MRIAAGISVGLAVMFLLTILWFFSTVFNSGILRLAVALVLSIAVASFGIGYFRQLSHPPPPEPEPTDVHPGLRLAYLCEMCGLELAVVRVAKDRAPRHCGDEMVLIRRNP